MGRRPKVKVCADPACPVTFTGRGLYCEGHRAGRDMPGSELRRERKAESRRRRRREVWDRGYASTGVTTPLHVSAGQRLTKLGHVGRGPTPIHLMFPTDDQADRAVDLFMAQWAEYTGGAS